MAYERDIRPLDGRSAVSSPYRSRIPAWSRLAPELRLSLVETALRPSPPPHTDGFPIAL